MADVEDILLPESQPPPTLGDGWNDLRLAVRRLLSLNAPALISLYDAAVRMLHDEQFPGRKYLIAHCVREIANSLPSFFGDVVEGRAEYQVLVQAIVEPWLDAGLPGLPLGSEAAPVSVGDAGNSASQAIPVPPAIVRRIGTLLEAHTAVYGRKQQNAATLFRALSATSACHRSLPQIACWRQSCRRDRCRCNDFDEAMTPRAPGRPGEITLCGSAVLFTKRPRSSSLTRDPAGISCRHRQVERSSMRRLSTGIGRAQPRRA